MNKINFLIAGMLLLMTSCKDGSDEVTPVDPVNKEPSASISIESASETLWNEVKVTIDASDADGTIESVELFANDELIGSDPEAPYEFTWNTKDVEDGEFELKAKVTDNLNAVKEATKSVQVMNTLIDFDLFTGFMNFSPNYKYFAYISSNSKEVLFFDQIEETPYQSEVIRPDDFDDEVFDVHIIYANGLNGYMTTYDDFSPGVFAPVNEDQKGAELGETNMTFSDIPTHDYFFMASYSGNPLESDNPYNLKVYENLDLGYLYLRNGTAGYYKILNNLSPGDDNTSLSATGFQMDQQTITIEDLITGFNINVYGHTGPGTDAPSVKLFGHFNFGDMDGYEVSFHTPSQEGTFDHFSSFLAVSQDGKSYITESYIDVLTVPVKMNGVFQVNSNTLNDVDIAVSGDTHDVLISTYAVTHDGFNFTWESHSEDENIEFPFIPTELTSAFPKMTNANFAFKEASIYLRIKEYDHLNGYGPYLDAVSGRTGKSMKDGGTINTLVGQSFNP